MFNITSLNGIIGDILNGIMNAIITAINAFLAPIFNAVLSVFYQLIFGSMCGILNACQKLFRIFAGTEAAIYTEAGKTAFGQSTVFGGTTGNMVFDFLLSQTVMNVFIKILVLAVALLIIFTIVAIIKNEYSTEVTKADNNKFKILASSGRALMGLLFVPIICILGIYASNQILIAVDGATNGGSSYMGTRVFVACSFNANRARIDEEFAKAMCVPKGADGKNYSAYGDIVHNNYDFGVTMTGDSEQSISTMMEKVAQKIDTAFLSNSKVPGGGNSWNNSDSGFGTGIEYKKMSGNDIYPETFDCTSFWVTFYYYDLWEFDFVMAGIVIVVLSFLYIKLLITLAKRIYEIILLFLMSPVLLAMMPLDEGKAIKDWRTTFLQKVLMVYAPVVAMNLFLSIFGMFTSVDSLATITNALLEFTGIDLTASTASGLPLLLGAKSALLKAVPGLYKAYNLITCIFMIAGVMVVDQTSSWVAKWIGGEDAIKSGKDQYDKGKGMMKAATAVGVAALTGGAALAGGVFRGAASATAKVGKAAGKGVRRGMSVLNKDKRRALQGNYQAKKDEKKNYIQAQKEQKQLLKDAKAAEKDYLDKYGEDNQDYGDAKVAYNQLLESGMSSSEAQEAMLSSDKFKGKENAVNAVAGVDVAKERLRDNKLSHKDRKAKIKQDRSAIFNAPLKEKNRKGVEQATVAQYRYYNHDVDKLFENAGGSSPNIGGGVSKGGSSGGGEDSAPRRLSLTEQKEQKKAEKAKIKAEKAKQQKKEKEEIYKNAAKAMEELEKNQWKPS